MLGSDKHHICLKGANINDLYSSYHKQACNDRGLLSRKHKSFRYCDFIWQIKTDNLQCHQLSERDTLLMITISDIKSIRNAVAGIKQVLRKQKKTLFKLI